MNNPGNRNSEIELPVNNRRATLASDSGNGNVLPPSESTNKLEENSRILNNNGWLCGFRVDNMDGPQALTRRVASYVDGAAPMIEETNNILTETITAHNKRESNYIHQGWSNGAVATISPWTSSRIDATNLPNPEGDWVTRRTLVTRLRVQVLLEDLAPVPELVAAIEEALDRPTRFEKFQAVYGALNRWGDVVPLDIEIGTSLSLTDAKANFAQLPATALNNLGHLSTTTTANMIRKGAASNVGWDDAVWAKSDVPATEWQPTRIIAVVPTLSLLANDIQTRLANLHDERLSYDPPLAVDQISWPCKMHDDMKSASRSISKVDMRSGDHIVALSVTYLDGVTSRAGGGIGGNEQTFVLTEGEHIIEMLTCVGKEWLHGIQFITNKGRCSVIYGRFQGALTISRSEGGVLSGFSISTRQHSEFGYMITGVNGIWRHDLIPRAPKESDVYSDYIRGTTQHGTAFNDRALIGNSSSIYISSVEVRAQGDIHSIEFTYTDPTNGRNRKFKSPRHGGSHGPYHRFDLEKGEHIVSVTGKFSEHWLTQLCFGTNLGRTSDVYGGGAGQSFSVRAPLGEDGKSLRLQYVIGEYGGGLAGAMFVWTPGLPR